MGITKQQLTTMTEQTFPITPPPELVRQWLEDGPEDDELGISKHIATQAASWGSDQELEACIAWMKKMGYWGDDDRAIPALRSARRPKPPSLKEEALKMLDAVERCTDGDYYTIRLALESLPS